MRKIGVVIVDDIAEIQEILKEIVDSSPEMQCIATFAAGEDCLKEITELAPDIVMMDINLGLGMCGIKCVEKLKPILPNTNFMMCTVYDDDEKIFDALAVGASGYILKKASPENIQSAIIELYMGGSPMSRGIARKVIASFQTKPPVQNELAILSSREQEVLEKLAIGLKYKEIAAELFVSSETVRKHAYHIYEKLQVANKVEAINILNSSRKASLDKPSNRSKLHI